LNQEKVILDQSGHGHGHDLIDHLYIHEHTPIHELPGHLKVVAALSFILVVVATPAKEPLAFFGYFLVLISIATIAKLRLRTLAKRMLIEIPFVFFAILIPFATPGEKIEFLGLNLSPEGLWVAFGILAKSTLGVMVSIILSATTQSRELLTSFQKLKVPATLIQIAAFMFRYTAVVLDEMHRMKVARLSRGFEAKGVADWRILGQSIGALFIRSYERGERVHLAMLSRGYDGNLISAPLGKSSNAEKFRALIPALIAITILILVRNFSE
jgi:cobalt/nickel transport system permease protein